VSGSGTQTVSGGTLETSTPASETHTWTVRATSSGTKQLTVTGQGGTMGETFSSSDQVSFEADCSPPAVRPTGTTVTPDGIVECGTERLIETRFVNDSHTDAEDAQATLAIPSGVELAGGPLIHGVSGGILELQSTSEPRSWTVLQTQPGIAPLTITGSGQSLGQQYAYPEQLALACTQSPGPGPGGELLESRTILEKVKLRDSKLIARGKVESTDGAPIGGEVVVVWRRGDRTRDREVGLAAGAFKAKTRVCHPGRWKIEARYPGQAGYGPSSSPTKTVKVSEAKLNC
jgi:hypothetical protein